MSLINDGNILINIRNWIKVKYRPIYNKCIRVYDSTYECMYGGNVLPFIKYISYNYSFLFIPNMVFTTF